MITKQQWQQAEEEFGERAFERYGAAYMGEGIGFANPKSNRDIEVYNCPLRPLSELFEHDVEIYGDNAYLMWTKYNSDKNSCVNWNDNSDSCLLEGKMFIAWQKRKTSAELPFDLERAKKGDVVEYFNSKEWETALEFKECHGTKIHKITTKIGIDWYFPIDKLRMKYPPRWER